jgi:chemotaxis response regulator CheB
MLISSIEIEGGKIVRSAQQQSPIRARRHRTFRAKGRLRRPERVTADDGLEVTGTATDGEQALASLERQQPDVAPTSGRRC